MVCRPDDLKIFLKSLPSEGRSLLRNAPPLERVHSASGASIVRFAAAPPSRTEIAVAASVMTVTAALGFWAIMAAAG